MTRRDYQLLAQALQHVKPLWDVAPPNVDTSYKLGRSAQFDNTVLTVAEYLARDNKAFNKELFLQNCGVDND